MDAGRQCYIEFCSRYFYMTSEWYSTPLLCHFLLNVTNSLPHTWTRCVFTFHFFKFLSLHKSFGLNIWPSPILQLITTCTPVITIWSYHHLLPGFYQCFLSGLGSLLILRPILCNSSTVHKTLCTFATPNLKSLRWTPMSLLVRINYFLSNPTLY